jgi:pimeloyl-ACP methyl ester carboxylesterase
MRNGRCIAVVVLTAALTGCIAGFGERATYGITFYCPGVGNMDLGDEGIRAGLEKAGYHGQVARMTWSLSFNPAIDQTVRIIAQQGGKRLAGYIQDYMDQYPGREVNVVGLSAGTGVAVWALEALKPKYKVSNVVLISSSLWHKYDVSPALRNVQGKIYNYYSPTDAVLAGPMKVFGSIDGVFLEDAAGAVGLQVPAGAESRIANVEWRAEFEQYGYYGGHGDGTNAAFVAAVIAEHIVKPGADQPPRTALARQAVTAPQAGRSD